MKKILSLVIMLTVFAVGLNVCAFSNQSDNNVYFYSQLSSDEKKMYDVIKSAAYEKFSEEVTIQGLSLLQNITIQYSNDLDAAVSENAEIKKAISSFSSGFQTAVDAFFLDHPECYWIDQNNLHSGYRIGGSSNGKRADLNITYIANFKIRDDCAGYKTDFDKIVNWLKENCTQKGSRLETLKNIHDRLAEHITYDKNASSKYDVKGSIINKRSVCEGYAEAFKLACDLYNIPCVVVKGKGKTDSGTEAHMWNYVKMENNQWYAVDVTWDDQASGILYDYFLAGADTKDTHFSKMTFSASHMAEGKTTDASLKAFSYPALSSKAYEQNSGVSVLPAKEVPSGSSTETPNNSSDGIKAGLKQPQGEDTPLIATAGPNLGETSQTGENLQTNEPTPTITGGENSSAEDNAPNSHAVRIVAIIIACVAVLSGGVCAAWYFIKKKK